MIANVSTQGFCGKDLSFKKMRIFLFWNTKINIIHVAFFTFFYFHAAVHPSCCGWVLMISVYGNYNSLEVLISVYSRLAV